MANLFTELTLPNGVTRRDVLNNMETKGITPALPDNMKLNDDEVTWNYLGFNEDENGPSTIEVALEQNLGDALFKAYSSAKLSKIELPSFITVGTFNRQKAIDYCSERDGHTPVPDGMSLESEEIDIDGTMKEYWTYTDGTNTVRLHDSHGDALLAAHIRECMMARQGQLAMGVLP